MKIKTLTHRFFKAFDSSHKVRIAIFSLVISLFAIPSVFAGGPERPTFTSAAPANYVTFNSITDNPEHGDERNFTLIREAGVGTYANEIKLQVGKEYEVYSYYHNNAKSSLNPSGQGIATGVRMSAQLPSAVKPGERGVVGTGITATNSNPTRVWDEAYVTSDTNVLLRYVPASARIHSGGKVNNAILSEGLFSTSGTFLGYDSLNGIVPGCADYAGYVIYKIKIDKPAFDMSKDVSLADKNTWTDSTTAAPGAKIDYRITYKNTGTTDQTNVTIKDALPAGMKYDAGSTKLVNISNPNGMKMSDNVVGPGVGIGNYGPGAGATVTFSATIAGANELACGQLAIRNTASVITNNGTRNDTADVVVTKEGCATAALPTTGPVEVIAGLVGIAALTIGVIYYFKSRRELQDVIHGVQSDATVVSSHTEHHDK